MGYLATIKPTDNTLPSIMDAVAQLAEPNTVLLLSPHRGRLESVIQC